MVDPVLTVLGFETSNNMKVRVALGYKGIPYRFETVDPADRARLVELSGQNLTPVLLHGDTVLFDSAAILRYLDANFRDTPRLFGNSRDEQWAIEDAEHFSRVMLAGPMMRVIHNRVAGTPLDDAAAASCNADFELAVRSMHSQLTGEWLCGDAMTAADITAAAVLRRVRSAEIFPIPEGTERLQDWEDRVMAFDGLHRVD